MSKIFNISEASSIAVHSLALIAKAKRQMNANEIVELTNFSKNHLSKVLQQLVKNNYIKSVRGPKGGFELNKDSKKITLLEIYEIMEGSLEQSKCNIHNGECHFSYCIFGNYSEKFTNEFKSYLKNKTIYDISL
jgi:Rrf2 family protein